MRRQWPICLAEMHWGFKKDAADVEFVLDTASEKNAFPKPAELAKLNS